MIERYQRPEMAAIWSLVARCEQMRRVEVAVARAQAQKKIIPLRAAQVIGRPHKLSLRRMATIERRTGHDVVAFVQHLSELVGPTYGGYVHHALTSSDVLDTALSLQIQQATPLLLKSIDRVLQVLKQKTLKHQDDVCVGRTHGVHAEITTFGFKLLGFWCELKRNRDRVQRALQQAQVCKISGAVGTYAWPKLREVERLVAKNLKLQLEPMATQVLPRDRHAEVFSSLALLASGLERLAVELRHLQRTEVAEVFEGTTKGQKGSSAMPHKKNPISAENITGLARLLRGYAHTAQENIVLWHERDISHSSVERVIFPDAFLLSDYALYRMHKLLQGLQVRANKMRGNMFVSQGKVLSGWLLSELVQGGMPRARAHDLLQSVAHNLQKGECFLKQSKAHPQLAKLLAHCEFKDYERRLKANLRPSFKGLRL